MKTNDYKFFLVGGVISVLLVFTFLVASFADARVGDVCDGGNGICKDIRAAGYSCNGTVTVDDCGGVNNVMCCSYKGKPCDTTPRTQGECLNKRTSQCNGVWKTGLCPTLNVSNSDIQCCSETFEPGGDSTPAPSDPVFDPLDNYTPSPDGTLAGPQDDVIGRSIRDIERTGLSGKSIKDILTTFLTWLLAIFGTLAIIALVISGIQYLLAVGNEDMATAAKKNIMYSIIGIVVAMASLIIVRAIDALLKGMSIF